MAWFLFNPFGETKTCLDEEETREAEDNEEDEEEASFPLSLLESEDLAEHPVADQVTALWNTAAWSIQWRLARNLRDPVHGSGGRGDRGRNTEFWPQRLKGYCPCLEEGSEDVHPCIGWRGQDGLSGLEELLCVGE